MGAHHTHCPHNTTQQHTHTFSAGLPNLWRKIIILIILIILINCNSVFSGWRGSGDTDDASLEHGMHGGLLRLHGGDVAGDDLVDDERVLGRSPDVSALFPECHEAVSSSMHVLRDHHPLMILILFLSLFSLNNDNNYKHKINYRLFDASLCVCVCVRERESEERAPT